jgi:hypothetical protein
MTEIHIDRLTLNLSGLSVRDGERLARLIGEGLGTANLPDAESRLVGNMQVKIQADKRGDVDKLSKQIVADVLRQLQRTI